MDEEIRRKFLHAAIKSLDPNPKLIGHWIEKIDDSELWGYKLQEHLGRYYPEKEVQRIDRRKNLLGQPVFREIHFKDGTVITLCKRARVNNIPKDSWWFRNERRVRGRYRRNTRQR